MAWKATYNLGIACRYFSEIKYGKGLSSKIVSMDYLVFEPKGIDR